MRKLESTPTVRISFHGDGDVTQTVKANPDLARAAWDLCSAYTDATIRIDVSDRLTDAIPVEWVVNASSPKGRQTALLTQRKPSGAVFVTPA